MFPSNAARCALRLSPHSLPSPTAHVCSSFTLILLRHAPQRGDADAELAADVDDGGGRRDGGGGEDDSNEEGDEHYEEQVDISKCLVGTELKHITMGNASEE
ncbi:MAG: hypothetical protein SGPRY_002064 [Prymnesium sp.]